MTALFEVTSN